MFKRVIVKIFGIMQAVWAGGVLLEQMLVSRSEEEEGVGLVRHLCSDASSYCH